MSPSPAGDLSVTVDPKDGSSYVVRVGGEPWLHSGALRFFVNGEWHGLYTTGPPSPSPAAVCTPGKPNTCGRWEEPGHDPELFERHGRQLLCCLPGK